MRFPEKNDTLYKAVLYPAIDQALKTLLVTRDDKNTISYTLGELITDSQKLVDCIREIPFDMDKKVQTQLLKKKDIVLRFFVDHGNWQAVRTELRVCPKKGSKEFKKLSTFFETEKQCQQLDGTTADMFRIKDGKFDELLERLSEIPKTGFLTISAGNDDNSLQKYLAIIKLAEKIGVKPAGDVLATINDSENKKSRKPRQFTQAHSALLHVLEYIAGCFLLDKIQEKKHIKPVNISPDYTGDIIPKPPTDSYLKDLRRRDPATYAEKVLKTYSSVAGFKNDQGTYFTISDPTLLDQLPEYQEPTKLMNLVNLTWFNGFVTVFKYLQHNPNPPQKVKLKDLAMENGYYRERILKRHNKFDMRLKARLKDELILLKGSSYLFTYYDPKLKDEMIGDARLVNFDISKDGDYIANLSFTEEFWQLVNGDKTGKPILFLTLPQSIDRLDTIEGKILAMDINHKFVDNYQMEKTKKGEPISYTLSELCDLLSQPHTTKQQRYKAKLKIIGVLDQIIKEEDLISKYEIKKVKKTNNGFVIYPSKTIRDAYRTEKEYKGQKEMQRQENEYRKKRLKELKELTRKDLRENIHANQFMDAVVEDLNETLKDLGYTKRVTKQEIGEMLIKDTKKTKATPISDELLVAIERNIKLLKEINGA